MHTLWGSILFIFLLVSLVEQQISGMNIAAAAEPVENIFLSYIFTPIMLSPRSQTPETWNFYKNASSGLEKNTFSLRAMNSDASKIILIYTKNNLTY